MRTAMEGHRDLLRGDLHGGGYVDEVAEDLPGLRIVVAAHALGDAAVQVAGEHQQCEVEGHFIATAEESAFMWKKRTPSESEFSISIHWA